MALNGGYSAFSSGPQVTGVPMPNTTETVPQMSNSIPTSHIEFGCLSNDENPLSNLMPYGADEEKNRINNVK